MKKMKAFFKKLWEKICEFAEEHLTITTILACLGIMGTYISGLILWMKHKQNKVEYLEQELNDCNGQIEFFEAAIDHAIEMIEKEMIEKLSNK